MAQSIILKRSAIAGKVPDTASLNLGEIAINTYDGRLFFRKSGSAQSVEHILTTNSTTTGSITLTGTGSFGSVIVTGTGSFGALSVSGTGSFNEIFVTTDINVTGSGYFIGDIVGLADVDVAGDLSGSHGMLIGKNALRVTSGSTNYTELNSNLALTGSAGINGNLSVTGSTAINGNLALTGSAGISGDLTVLGAVNARQFNINVISSSILFNSGSTQFGDTIDDVHSFTGSVRVSGSVTASSFKGDGSGLTGVIVDLSTAQLNDVDGNSIPARSFAELYVACAISNIVDLDFGA